AHAIELNEVDDALQGLAVGNLLAPHSGREQHTLQLVGLQPKVAAGHDVVEHAHVREQLDMLEGARDTEPRHGARRQARYFAAAKADDAVAAVNAVDAIEGAGLAGTVWADQRE